MTTTAQAVELNPIAITEGEAQQVSADLTRLDKAKEATDIVVNTLMGYYVIPNKETADKALAFAKTAAQIEKAIETKRKQLVTPFNDQVTAINAHAKVMTSKIAEGIAKVKTSILQWQQEEARKAAELKVAGRKNQLLELGFTYDELAKMYVLVNVANVSARELESHTDVFWADLLNSFKSTIKNLAAAALEQAETIDELLDAFGTDEDKTAVAEQKEAIAATAAAVDRVPAHISAAPAVAPVKGTTKRWVFEVEDASLVPREYLVVNETAIRKAVNEGARTIPGVRIYQDESISLR